MTGPIRRAQRIYHDPIKYSLDDIGGQERFDDLQIKVADWFSQWRDSEEPAADARHRIRCCMEGKTLEGKQWFTHWNTSFATRMRMLCSYDVDRMEPIRKAPDRKAHKKKEKREREAKKRREADPFMPELIRAEQNKDLKYGEMKFPVTEAEQRLWEHFRDGYLEQFPQLRTVNGQAELSMLCDLHLIHERNRLKMLSGIKVDERSVMDTTKIMMDMKKALGIAPDQLAKRVQKETGSTIAEAVSKMGSFEQARELRDRFFAEELLTLWQQYQTPSPRPEDNGYQLDEVGLFGQTRCRTCHCAKCGHRNFAGLSIEEIEAHLQKRGLLELAATP